MSTIPQGAIDWLNKNMGQDGIEAAFDAEYGTGQAARVLAESAPKAPVEAPQAQEEPESGLFYRAMSDIAEGIFEAPATVIAGAIEGAVINPADYIARNIGDIQMSFENGIEFLSAEEYNRRRDELGQKPFGLETVENVGRDTVTGNFVGEASQFAAAFLSIGKVVKAGGTAITAGKSALAAFGAYRGDEGRLSDMLLDMGVPENQVLDFMKSNPEDSETMGRLKNTIEEGALGFAAVQLVGLFKAAKLGDTKAYEAAVEGLRSLQDKAKRGVDDVAAAIRNSEKIVAKEPKKVLYRSEADKYDRPDEGAVFYSSDQSYVDLYQGEGRTVVETKTPNDVFDIRESANSQKAAEWVKSKANDLEASSGASISSELSAARKMAEEGNVSGAMANLNIAIAKDKDAPILAGVAEKQFMDDNGIAAMTVKEAGRDAEEYSVAFAKNPQKAPEKPTDAPTEAASEGVQSPQSDTKFAVTPAQELAIRNEARRVAEGGEPKADLGWRDRNLFKDMDDVESEIVAMRTVMADEFAAANKPQSEKVWKMQAGRAANRLAKLTGVDDDKVLDSMSGFDNPSTMAADLMARENFALTLADDLKAMSKALRLHNDMGDMKAAMELGYDNIDDLKLAIVQRRELAANVVAQVQGQRSNIARAMRAMQVQRQGSDELKAVIRDEGVARDADRIADAVLDTADEGILAAAGKNLETAFDKVNTYRINALLSGPGTQEVNTISNAVNTLVVPLEQLAGAAVTLNKKGMTHAVRTIKHTVMSSHEATQSSLRALYNDDAILDPFNSKFDVEVSGAAKNAVGKVVQLPSRFLMGMDEFFKQATYRGRLMADILDEADTRGLQGKNREDYISERLKGAYSEDGAALDNAALLQAQRITFTEKLEPGSFGETIQNAAIRNPFVRFIVPFVRTPMNILSQGVQKIPGVGAISKRFRDDIAAGGARRQQAIGKQVLGTALSVSAFNLAMHGITREDGTRIDLIGSGPKDQRVRRQWLQRNKPYSLRVTDPEGNVTFRQYQRYEPLSYVLALTADAAEVMQYTDDTSRVETGELVAMVVSVMAENTVNKTFTQGISDFMKALTDTEQSMETFVESAAGSFVPNIIPQVLDEKEKREIRGAMDSVMNRIGMSGKLDRKRNALGEVQLNYGSKMDPMQVFTADNREADKLMDEITRLSMVHSSSFDAPRSRFGDVDLRDVPYSDNQSMFDRWMEKTSEVKVGGKTLRVRLEEFVSSERYKRLADGDRDLTGKNEQQIKKIIRKYRDKAKGELMREDDAFKETIKRYETNKRLVKRPRTLEQEINNGPR